MPGTYAHDRINKASTYVQEVQELLKFLASHEQI